MAKYDDYFNTNRLTWNKKVGVHKESHMYGLEDFLKGKSSLNSHELEALGDVRNKSLLHLQCHFGQDTLSWSRMGAKCTGIDISDEGIELAKKLNNDLGLDADFVCCNVLDTSDYVKEKFDIVFTSYGVIGWLPDLKPWAKMIAERLKKGGVFFIAEFHPIVWIFDYADGKKNMRYGYMQKDVIYEEYEGTYADVNSKIVSKEFGWNHGLGEIVTSLIEAGLTIEYLKEYDETPYNILPGLVKTKSGKYELEEHLYPLIFTLKAIHQ